MNLLAEAHSTASRAFRDYAAAIAAAAAAGPIPKIGAQSQPPQQLGAYTSVPFMGFSPAANSAGISAIPDGEPPAFWPKQPLQLPQNQPQHQSQTMAQLQPPSSSQSLMQQSLSQGDAPSPESDIGSKPVRKKRRQKDPDAPKAPAGKWIWFAKEYRPIVREALGSEASAADINEKLKQKWLSLRPEEMKKFDDLAAQDRSRYATAIIAYKGESIPPYPLESTEAVLHTDKSDGPEPASDSQQTAMLGAISAPEKGTPINQSSVSRALETPSSEHKLKKKDSKQIKDSSAKAREKAERKAEKKKRKSMEVKEHLPHLSSPS